MSCLCLYNLEEERDHTHVKVAVDTKLVRLMDVLVGKTIVWRDIIRPEERDNGNLLKCNKDKYKSCS